MSDTNRAEAVDAAPFDKARNFIDARRKKKSPSKSDGKRFSELWMKCVAELGVNERTLSLLCDGFRYSNARPLHAYCMGEESKTFLYSTLRTYRCVREGHGDIELRLYISLFALELVSPTSGNQLSWLMKAIPQAAVNKEGNINGNLQTYLRKLLLEEVEGRPLLPKRKQDDTASRDFTLFSNFLSSELRSMISGLKTPSLQSTAQSLIEWLSGNENNDTQESLIGKDPSEAMVLAKEAIGNHTDSVEPGESSSENDAMKSGPASAIGYEDVIAFVRRQQKSLESVKDSLSVSEASTARFKGERDSLRLRVAELESKLEEARERSSFLERELSASKKAREKAIAESAAKEELFALSQKTKTKQTDEATKRVAKKLSIEYRDYRDAIGLDMDVDLGENMRLQLGSVFEILIDAGFEL